MGTGPFGKDGVTLIGDAAHPSVWFGGGGRAMLDAVALASKLGALASPLSPGTLPAILRSFEDEMQARHPAEESLTLRDNLPSAINEKQQKRYEAAMKARPTQYATKDKERTQAAL